MMRIKFDTDHKVKQADGNGPNYVAGKTYEFSGPVSETYARKYIARGYAHEIGESTATVDAARADQASRDLAEAQRKADEAAKLAERSKVEIPDDVESLPWAELRELATQLTDEAIHNKKEALAAITAERGRRVVSA